MDPCSTTYRQTTSLQLERAKETLGLYVCRLCVCPGQVHIVLTGGSHRCTDPEYFDFVVENLPKKDISASWDRLGEGLHTKDKNQLFARLPDHVCQCRVYFSSLSSSLRRCNLFTIYHFLDGALLLSLCGNVGLVLVFGAAGEVCLFGAREGAKSCPGGCLMLYSV